MLHLFVECQNKMVFATSHRLQITAGVPLNVTSATMADVIAFDSDRDLQPLLLQYCNYSLAVGQNLQISYDMAGFEVAIMERLFRSRPLLQMDLVDTVFYDEATCAELLSRVSNAVPQSVTLPPSLCVERLRKIYSLMPLLTLSLSGLHVTMDFLAQMRCSPDMLLHDFMTKELHLPEKVLLAEELQQDSKCCHVTRLWFVLAERRLELLALAGEEPFYMIPMDVRVALEEETVKERLVAALRVLPLDKLCSELFRLVNTFCFKFGFVLHGFLILDSTSTCGLCWTRWRFESATISFERSFESCL